MTIATYIAKVTEFKAEVKAGTHRNPAQAKKIIALIEDRILKAAMFDHDARAIAYINSTYV